MSPLKEDWANACQRWLDLSFKHLADQARNLANGDRGVLVISVGTDEMKRVLEASPGSTVPMRLDPIWLPAEEFLQIIKDHHDDRDAWSRWGPLINAMEPTRDVALYLHSDPETELEGSTFSRFLVTSDAPARDVDVDATDKGDVSRQDLFEQEQAFRHAHAACVPDRLEYTIWLPPGLDEASVTVKCACGATTTIACAPPIARTTLAAFRMNGIPVREINAPEGIQ